MRSGMDNPFRQVCDFHPGDSCSKPQPSYSNLQMWLSLLFKPKANQVVFLS